MILRRRTGLTQVQLAAKLGKSPSTIAKWEAHDIVPRLKPSEIRSLCEAYTCTLDELIEAFEGKSAEGTEDTSDALSHS
jgi:transcriptional regulator with XRE-family HTH domain